MPSIDSLRAMALARKKCIHKFGVGPWRASVPVPTVSCVRHYVVVVRTSKFDFIPAGASVLSFSKH